MSDFDELLAVLDLRRVADDRFIGSHPSKNPMRTFGGLLVAQSFVASTRTLTREELPPSALSVHFINGGDTTKDIEFHVVRLRDERRFANRRVDAVQDGTLLSSAMISYMSGGPGSSTPWIRRRWTSRTPGHPSASCCAATRPPSRTSSTRCNRSSGAIPMIRPG
ncbi:thioesterase-like superfamily protein [Mycobacterium kansasii 824]|nr:thioesterase-like superfamily protein [Mycobacterium kansasii 824]